MTVSPLSRGWWRVGNRQKTDPCHCHSDLILGPFPRASHICRSGMASMDQRKWLVGFKPVAWWTGLLTSIAPLSPPLSNFTLLSGWGVFKRDPIISAHQSDVSSLFRCHWQRPAFSYTYISLALTRTSFCTYYCWRTLAHLPCSPNICIYTHIYINLHMLGKHIYIYMCIYQAWKLHSPPVPLSSSESGFPACPTSHRCSGSADSQQPHRGSPAHCKNKACRAVCFGCALQCFFGCAFAF